MSELIDYASSQEGLAALDSFLVRKNKFSDLSPFSLPVEWHLEGKPKRPRFRYYIGRQINNSLQFFLEEDQIASLGETMYVVPHQEASKGQHPYYWLNFHKTPEVELPVLTSCRLNPRAAVSKIDFYTWHGLGEQLIADYVLGINDLKFTDLLPFDLTVDYETKLRSYRLAGVSKLWMAIYAREGDTLRFIPRTDDQHFYEWIDVLKVDNATPEEKWPLVSSIRILRDEHRISSVWGGPERQLLMDHIQGKSEVRFENLRPIRATAINNGRKVSLINPFSLSELSIMPKAVFTVKSGLLSEGDETITIPKRDNEGRYEWLELYRFDPLRNQPVGEILAAARITPEGRDQRQWYGVEIQLLRDYTDKLIFFAEIKNINFKVTKGLKVNLWMEDKQFAQLVLSRRFNLKPGDNLTLVPEKETEKGTDFLLVKEDITLARYRLDLRTKKFKHTDNLITESLTNIPVSSQDADKALDWLISE